ncbi:conserved membrane protein of unknown function [Burkholderia multivorans]
MRRNPVLMSFKFTLPAPAARADLFAATLFALICAAPLFLVTIRGWAGAVLFAGSLGAAACLLIRGGSQSIQTMETRDARWVTVTLLLPLAAVLLSSALRGKFSASLFDSPSRFVIAIPILLLVIRHRFSVARWLQYTVPAALVVTLPLLHFFEGPVYWGNGRMATYFADPLTLGQYAITLGLMSLASINLFGRDSYALVALKCAGAAFGSYLSICSGSRSGWVAVPIVIAFLVLSRRRKLQWREHIVAIGAVAALLGASYRLSPTIHARVGQALIDYMSYNWTGIAPDTSVGMRITFLRIGAYLVSMDPLRGFGDTGFASMLNVPALASFASPFARDYALHAGFHNEVMTNAVRSGIWGIVATLALFIVPLLVFSRAIRSPSRERIANGTLGVVFMIGQIVSSMSTEVFNLKFTASFAAVFIAALCGSSIARYGQE